MLGAFANAFRTPDLRRKLLFVVFIIILFRLGSQVPSPGVHVANVAKCIKVAQTGENADLYSLINLFSGGAMMQLSVFALGIMPYITAAIIVQLLTVVIPRFEELKKEGQAGQTKMTQYTRYLTLGLALLQASGIVALARSGQLIQGCPDPLLHDNSTATFLVMVITMTAGTVVVMWLGELITERGVGNGMSLLIFCQVVATFPASLWRVKTTEGWGTFAIVLVIGLVTVAAVVFVEQSQRRIPVQYAKRMVGRRMFGGTSTYIPLKVNQAGIIPIIFASSLMYLPAMAAQFNAGSKNPVMQFIEDYLVNGSHPLYMALYFLMIIFFAYFYVAITFNPEEVADNMKKYGGFIPGIRAGKPTGALPVVRAVPHHLPGAAVPRHHLVDPAGRPRPDQRRSELPVRRRLHPDHGGRRPRHGEADREPAPAAQLRRIPPMRLLIMGPPGAGKGTQAVYVAERFGIPAISTGDIFRANVSQGTELGREAQRYMDAGEYVPDEVTNSMVRDRIAQDDARRLPPRRLPALAQVEELDQMIEATGHRLDAVVVLTADSEEIVARLLQRAQTEGRADDTEDVIRRRQEVYVEQTAPLIDVYRSRDLLVEVDGMGDVAEVTDRVLSALESVTES